MKRLVFAVAVLALVACAKQEATPAADTTAVAPAAAPAAAPAEPPADPPGYWPADWRRTVAKEDAKVQARLERYASPEVALQALIAAQNKISSGELRPKLGKDASPEQLAEWREAHGIPAAPDQYNLGKDVEGMDGEWLKKVYAKAHETNQTPDQIKASLGVLKELTLETQARRSEEDQRLKTESEEALRAEWGAEYRRNVNLINSLLDGEANPELKEKVLGGRLADGTPFGSSPEMMRLLASLALIKNPTGIVVPGSEANPLKGVSEEIAAIEKVMRENRRAYNKDEKMQARYRDLLDARIKLGR